MTNLMGFSTDILARANRTYLVVSVIIMPAVANVLIALFLANQMFEAHAPVMLWGEQSMVVDLVMSSVFATLITGTIAWYTTLVQCRNGKVHTSSSKNKVLAKSDSQLSIHSNFLTIKARARLVLLGCVLGNVSIIALFVSVYPHTSLAWEVFLSIKILQACVLSLIAAFVGTSLAMEQHDISLMAVRG